MVVLDCSGHSGYHKDAQVAIEDILLLRGPL